MSGTTFNEDGQIDAFTVPTSGTYVITAIGATGGGLGLGYAGGAGAEVEGTFTLNAGDVLHIVVGGAGVGVNGGAGSGGGGSFVYDVTTSTLLEAAGGGGGASAGSGGTGSPGGPGKPGTATTSGSAGNGYVNGFGVSPGGAGGTGGSGGGVGTLTFNPAGSGSGGGGGGFSSAGGNGEFGQGGASFLAGGAGGTGAALDTAHNGGFGGGGGANSDSIGAGGGGGYSGGGGGEEDIGGGGGSYVSSLATSVVEIGGENAAGNGVVTIMPCFVAGTRILTSRGERAVETLAVGDAVAARGAGLAPITWIGHRRIDCRRHPAPAHVWPVRISPGAFGAGMPHSELWLSPDHAVLVDGLLIAIRQLVNGTTIVQIPCDDVTYFHVELARHDVLSAEGLAAESYRDTGNRTAFANAGPAMALHPAFDGGTRAASACAPLAVAAAQVEPVWRCLAALAAAAGAPVPMPAATRDPGLRLRVAGRDFAPSGSGNGRYVFVLPARAAEARLLSRAAAPSDLRPWLDDRRRLGVAVSRIVRHDRTGVTELPVDHPALRDGWHAVEQDGSRLWRWTDGDAAIPLGASAQMVEIHCSGCSEYPVAAEARCAAAGPTRHREAAGAR